ncbi:MAG: serine/threonine-protein kinase [Bdellovibrionia bacterium]
MSTKPEYFGKYILLEKLAVGGMAEVYLGKVTGAENIAKFVAVKRILPQHSRNQDFIEMFKEEAKIAIHLSHGNIVPIFEFGEDKGQFYLTMEYVEGRNLRQIVNRMKENKKHMSIEQAVYVINEAARGLDHAHRCIDGTTGRPLNIIHRDISPQNVMISFEGGVKIVDFGIAKAESKVDSTRLGTLKGKFSYMSPEQADGQDVDFRTDIFSLGIVLWELLANERLFSANNEMNTLRKIRECQIPSLHKIDSNIPLDLEKICTKALARDRNLRYQSAAEFHRDLNRFLNRQFPDFSTPDFSTSVKQLFAEEIIESRRRLVEYAKISSHQPGEDKTVTVDLTKTITETDTNSKMPSSTSASIPALQTLNLAVNTNTTSENSSTGSSGPKLETVSKTPAPVQAKTKLAIVPLKPSASGITPNAPPAPDRSQIPEKFTTPAHQMTLQRRTQPQQQQKIEEEVSDESGSFGAVGLLSLLIILGVGWTMREEPPLSKLLCTQFNYNCKRELNTIGDPTPPPQIFSTNIEMVVMSEPAGAEIFIDGKSLGLYTPSKIRLQPTGKSVLSLRKEGYSPHKQDLVAPRQGDSLKVTLTRTDIGYITITVRPTDAVTIYVDENELQERPPVNRYPVRAGKRVKVRAFDPLTRASAEKTVVVRPDTNQDVNLFLNTNSH